MRFFSRLMPREGRFFKLFDQHAEFVVKGSIELVELLRHFSNNGDRATRVARILELEHSADRVTRETVSLLHQTFVTPLDRDDIHRLISRMDDILDLIQDTAESLGLYDIQHITPDAVELARLVHRCCERVQAAVALLSSMDHASQALKICQEI